MRGKDTALESAVDRQVLWKGHKHNDKSRTSLDSPGGVAVTTVQIAFLWLCSDVLIIQRLFRSVLISNATSLAVTVVTMDGFIEAFGMSGINYTLIISYMIGLIIAFLSIALGVHQRKGAA